MAFCSVRCLLAVLRASADNRCRIGPGWKSLTDLVAAVMGNKLNNILFSVKIKLNFN